MEVNGKLSREKLAECIPGEHIERLINMCSNKQIEFIISRLSIDELRTIKDPADYFPTAVVLRMPIERWKWYEKRFDILDNMHYRKAQIQWMKDRRWYMMINLGRDPSQKELADDIIKDTHFGLRNRAVYIFKYMSDKSKVKHKDDEISFCI